LSVLELERVRLVHGLLRFDFRVPGPGESERELRVALCTNEHELGAPVVAVGHQALGLGDLFLRELE
jgi:hypothetical protein